MTSHIQLARPCVCTLHVTIGLLSRNTHVTIIAVALSDQD